MKKKIKEIITNIILFSLITGTFIMVPIIILKDYDVSIPIATYMGLWGMVFSYGLIKREEEKEE